MDKEKKRGSVYGRDLNGKGKCIYVDSILTLSCIYVDSILTPLIVSRSPTGGSVKNPLEWGQIDSLPQVCLKEGFKAPSVILLTTTSFLSPYNLVEAPENCHSSSPSSEESILTRPVLLSL